MDKPIQRQVGGRTIDISGIGPDIDLDEEEVYLEDGTRLTEQLAAEIGQEIADEVARRRGRPSVTGGTVRTPNLTIRVPTALRARLQKIADAQGRRIADIGRDALTEYAKRHTAGGTNKAVAKAAPTKAIAKKAAPKKAAPRKRASTS